MGSPRWSLHRFRPADGSDPVWDFIKTDLTPGERGALEARLNLVVIAGLGTRGDVLEILGDNLYAVRVPNTPNNPRFFMCAITPLQFVMVHAYRKSTMKIPPSEQALARKRIALVISNPNKFIQ